MLLRGRLRGYRLLFRAGLIVFLWTTGSGVLWFLLPQIAEKFVGDVAVVGLLVSIPAVVAMFVDLPIGDLSDRLGGRRVLLFGLLALGLLGLSLLFVDNLVELIVFLVVLGLLYQMVYIPVIAYVMNISPRDESSEYLGFELSFVHSGYAVGPILAGVILAAGYGMLEAGSMLYVVGCLCAFVPAFIWFKDGGMHERLLEGIRDLMLKDKLFLKEILDYSRLKSTGLAILAVTFLFTFYDGTVWVIQPLYYGNFTSNAVLGGVIMSAFVLPLILFEFPGGWLADHIGRRRTLAFGMFVAGVFSIAFSLAGDVYSMFATAFMATTGLALAWPSMEGIFTVKTTADSRGSVIGVWSTARDLGYVVGPIGGGLLGHYFGLGSVFTILGVLLLAATLLVLAVKEK